MRPAGPCRRNRRSIPPCRYPRCRRGAGCGRCRCRGFRRSDECILQRRYSSSKYNARYARRRIRPRGEDKSLRHIPYPQGCSSCNYSIGRGTVVINASDQSMTGKKGQLRLRYDQRGVRTDCEKSHSRPSAKRGTCQCRMPGTVRTPLVDRLFNEVSERTGESVESMWAAENADYAEAVPENPTKLPSLCTSLPPTVRASAPAASTSSTAASRQDSIRSEVRTKIKPYKQFMSCMVFILRYLSKTLQS